MTGCCVEKDISVATIIVADWNNTSKPNAWADKVRAFSTAVSIMNRAEAAVPAAR
jgi:hypothetical protein